MNVLYMLQLTKSVFFFTQEKGRKLFFFFETILASVQLYFFFLAKSLQLYFNIQIPKTKFNQYHPHIKASTP